jgi:hypothetical protein
MIKVTITAAHITAAMYPKNSPIALALREIYSGIYWQQSLRIDRICDRI